MPLATFVALHETPETEHLSIGRPRFAVVLAHHGSHGVVLVFNRYRQVWELPGGLIDAGETAREAAARELSEEAGAATASLEWLGLTEVHDGSTHFGAVYRGQVMSLIPVESEEVGGIAYWTPGGHPEPLGQTDAALLERFGSDGF